MHLALLHPKQNNLLRSSSALHGIRVLVAVDRGTYMSVFRFSHDAEQNTMFQSSDSTNTGFRASPLNSLIAKGGIHTSSVAIRR